MSQPQSDSSGPHLIGWVADLRQGRPKISNALSYGKLSKLNDGPNFGPANMYGSISGEKAKVTLNPPDNDDNNPADTKILDLN